ncbi:hypothetical protein MMC14_006295 [Varicellaria rhodocarpa]|nr:hypothetical protein [Varicellaria rhodocarpa]
MATQAYVLSYNELGGLQTNWTRAGSMTKTKASLDCRRCEKKLSTEAILKRHYKEVHKMTWKMEPIVPKTFQCPDSNCPSHPFVRKGHLLQHMMKMHAGAPQKRGEASTNSAQRLQDALQPDQHLSPATNEPDMTNFSNLVSYPSDNVDFLSRELDGDIWLVSGGPTEYQPEISTQFSDPAVAGTFQDLPGDVNSNELVKGVNEPFANAVDTPYRGCAEILNFEELIDVDECPSGVKGYFAFGGNVGHDLGEPNEKVVSAMMEILGDLRLKFDKLDEQIRQLEELKAQQEKVSESILDWEGILGQIRARI